MWHLRLNFIVTLFSKWNRLQQRNIFSHWSKSHVIVNQQLPSLLFSKYHQCCSVSVCPGENKYLLRHVTEIDSRQEQQRWGNSRGHLGGGRGRSLGWPAAAALKKSCGILWNFITFDIISQLCYWSDRSGCRFALFPVFVCFRACPEIQENQDWKVIRWSEYSCYWPGYKQHVRNMYFFAPFHSHLCPTIDMKT